MFSTHAFFSNFDGANADTFLNAVPDATTFTQGTVLRVPPGRANLLAEFMSTVSATRNFARVETPSIRPLSNQYILPLSNLVAALAQTLIQFHPMSPRELQVAEQMQFLVNTDDAVAQDHFGVVWLGDGPIAPINGRIFTTRATTAIAQAAGIWVSGPITFQEQLPVTDFQVVGMRVGASDGIAARLIFSDSEFRPGALVMSANTSQEPDNRFRYGNMGVWGQFNVNQPPQLEILAGVDTAQDVYLDLIRVN